MRMLNRTSLTLTAAGSVLAVTATATSGAASVSESDSTPSADRVIATGVGAPFQIARRHGTVYFTDGFAGTINKITRKGTKVVARVPDVAGVEFSGSGKTMAIAHGGGPTSRVTLVRRGHRTVHAAVGQYEQKVNPDKSRTYGVVAGGSDACLNELANVPPPEGAPPGSVPPPIYKGLVDSHPYQLAPLRRGAFAVAEAGGNSILRVSRRGAISLIALLPPQPVKLTAAQATAQGAPSCAGATYAFEPVPTDVERARGALWVTTLPGGPEDPSLGARGSVYRIKHGVVKKVAGGFLGATNLGVVGGRVYVSEFFGGKITKFGKGGRFTRYTVPGAVSVEATRKRLFIGTFGAGPNSPGKVIRLPR
jgi:hypothetical protein